MGQQQHGRLSVSFPDIYAKLAPLAIKRPSFKFDIEGGEYDIFDTLNPELLKPFEVIRL